jgi:hypothetical protein
MGGDVLELSAALSAAAALTELADGVYYDPGDDLLYSADEAVDAARRDVASK